MEFSSGDWEKVDVLALAGAEDADRSILFRLPEDVIPGAPLAASSAACTSKYLSVCVGLAFHWKIIGLRSAAAACRRPATIR